MLMGTVLVTRKMCSSIQRLECFNTGTEFIYAAEGSPHLLPTTALHMSKILTSLLDCSYLIRKSEFRSSYFPTHTRALHYLLQIYTGITSDIRQTAQHTWMGRTHVPQFHPHKPYHLHNRSEVKGEQHLHTVLGNSMCPVKKSDFQLLKVSTHNNQQGWWAERYLLHLQSSLSEQSLQEGSWTRQFLGLDRPLKVPFNPNPAVLIKAVKKVL